MTKGLIVAVTLTVFLTGSGAAVASHNDFWADDDCGTTDSANDPYFIPDGPPEYWKVHGTADKAWRGCHMFTTTISYSNTDPINKANWYLPTNNSAYQGNYRVYLFVPCETTSDHLNQNDDVRYRRYGNGTSQGVTEVYRWTAKYFLNNHCATNNTQKLLTEINGGTYDNFGNNGYIQLIDKSDYYPYKISADRLDFVPAH